MKKISICIPFIIFLFGTACISGKIESIPTETLKVIPITKISSLSIKNIKLLSSYCNVFSVDIHQNIYLLDAQGHRIVKYNKNCEFQTQIGSIGQEKEGLYYPVGFCVDKELVYVLNEGGCEIKMFSTAGEYKSSFPIDRAWFCNSIYVIGELIYVNLIEKKRPTENEKDLIYVYSKDGRLVRIMGNIVKCNSLIGYSVFNRVTLAASDNCLFWAFLYMPFIGWKDLVREDSEQKLDLLELQVPEIKAKFEKAKADGINSPETIKPDKDLELTYSIFCNGFGVDKKERLYYIIHGYPEGEGQGAPKCQLIILKKNGRFEKRINLEYENKNIMVRYLQFGPGKLRYGIGKILGETLLFKF